LFGKAALFIAGAFCLMGAAAAPTRPLVLAVATEPSTLDGQAVIDRNSRVASGNIFESLLDRDRNGQIVPWLAESYRAVNDTTWRFRLRKGVKFHNGEPFNAEAAAFSVNRIIDKKFKTQRASYIENISGAKVVDPDTIDVTTDGANAVLPVQMTQLVMVPPKAAGEKNFGEAPVGSGPYKFARWDRGRDIVLTLNENYWGKKPAIREFVVRVIPDAQTQIAACRRARLTWCSICCPSKRSWRPGSFRFPPRSSAIFSSTRTKKRWPTPKCALP
jgi:peptide/nickel transport system substrate-binding protein